VWSSLFSVFVWEVSEFGFPGARVTIKCKYEDEYKTKLKSFCKNVTDQSFVKTDGKEPWAFQGRFSLHDNTEKKKMFVVTITALRIEDTGQYCCGIDSVGLDPFTVVHLTVSKGACFFHEHFSILIQNLDIFQWRAKLSSDLMNFSVLMLQEANQTKYN
uniref:Immunoglobulin V-set domain-containing protein n=1 Tax=Electrophorus electricus TaxID=8005 RepID=A0AAY5EZJ1_ELEEL